MARLRIASWNMHGGVGLDGRFSPSRIARVVGELDADVIALQEFGSRRAGFDLLAQLENATASRAIVMPTMRKHGCDFGNVVLSRWPVRDVACHVLDVDRREPRNAVDLLIDHPAGALRIVASHLGMRIAERRMQIARLRALLGAASVEPSVLLGDFNAWRGRNALRGFDEWSGMSTAPATFPSPCPVAALDRIWVAPASACVELRVHKSRTARIASDHLPLLATLELP